MLQTMSPHAQFFSDVFERKEMEIKDNSDVFHHAIKTDRARISYKETILCLQSMIMMERLLAFSGGKYRDE